MIGSGGNSPENVNRVGKDNRNGMRKKLFSPLGVSLMAGGVLSALMLIQLISAISEACDGSDPAACGDSRLIVPIYVGMIGGIMFLSLLLGVVLSAARRKGASEFEGQSAEIPATGLKKKLNRVNVGLWGAIFVSPETLFLSCQETKTATTTPAGCWKC